MTYKTILVHVGPDAGAGQRVRTALSLAGLFDATVFGVGAAAWEPMASLSGYPSGSVVKDLAFHAEEQVRQAEVKFRRLTQDHAAAALWRGAVDDPTLTMMGLARCADLIVAGRPPAHADARMFASPADLMMASGLPVLLPNGSDHVNPRTVVIGWKNTRETRRAIWDALPLLKMAERVMVLNLFETAAPQSVEQELADVVQRLARHGVEAEAESIPQLEITVAEDLLGMAQVRNADLIVVGAYGRSRLREWTFGGVTRDLLAAGTIPILFSR